MKAQQWRSGKLTGALIIFTLLILWAIRHIINIVGSVYGLEGSNFFWPYVFTFLILVITLAMAHKERPIDGGTEDEYVTVIVPAYNEDPALLRNCLNSMFRQTRKPNKIFVVDDGSTQSDYRRVKGWFLKAGVKHKVEVRWVKKKNGGKRHAQARAVLRTPKTSIYVTVDSDSVLDTKALSEALKPFSNPEVQSVAGVVLAMNNRVNLLARFTDLIFVTGQLIDRSMMSAFGSVLVNSGGLALYRANIIRENLNEYLNENFFGKHIEFSDDSMLTLYSLRRGKTVQQPTAFVFTMMPEKLSHHIRQQIRWMRGSFIRSWWRLKYLPLLSFGFWRQALGWSQLTVTTVLFILLFVVRPIFDYRILPALLIVPILIGYVQALRYLSYRRSDQSFKSQFCTYLLAPLASLWSFFIFRPLRFYAIATCLNSAWGTRSKIEVKLAT